LAVGCGAGADAGGGAITGGGVAAPELLSASKAAAKAAVKPNTNAAINALWRRM